jgi:hypothetical protein
VSFQAGDPIRVVRIIEEEKYVSRVNRHLNQTGTVRVVVPKRTFPNFVRMDDGTFQTFRDEELEKIS